ncbi:AAA-like domain protein [compost metagenome]
MNHSPSSFLKERKSKEFQEVLMSDENLASLTPYKTHGFIGDGTGTLLGIDTGSKTPFILNFFATGARQILLVNAPAGHGKTILTFGMILSLCAGNKHCSALDVKGGEYGKLSKFVKTLIIDISETSKSYVNTMRLDDVEVETVDDCIDFYNMAFTATEGLLLMACKPSSDKEMRDMSHVLKMAITKLFSSRKVDKRSPKSLRNTKNIKYEDTIPILDELKNSPSYAKYSSIIDDMKVSIETKFRIEDTFKGREITIQDIIETPLIIYELNRNNPSSVSEDDAMRTQMISYLDMKKISIRKKMREGTVCIYEELARIEEFKAMLKFITAIVTGARSSNVMVILLMNTISVLDMPGMEPLKSNLSTLIIGPLESESDYKVLKSINGHRLEPMVKKIQSNKTQFRNYFAVQYDTGIDEGICMMKAFIPEHILEDLETRDRMI